MNAFGRRFLGVLSLVFLFLRVGALSLIDGRSLGQDIGQHEDTFEKRQERNRTIPAPIIASVSQYWEGNDGPWSSFTIQVGNRPQELRVFPSTSSTSTWVVYDVGCPRDAPNNCAESRGRTFNPNNSLTWVPNSIFNLEVDTFSDLKVFGDFGFDSVTLGYSGSGGPKVDHGIVAGIGDTTYTWLGVLGLNPRPTNFSTFLNNPQTSFIQALKNQNSIPSLSWAYTAGAPYRLNKIFGSLVLGGYDTARFRVPASSSPDLTFSLYTDISRDLLVGISSISTSNTTSSTSETALLKDSIFAFIDSTIPYLWLPLSVCQAFEAAFGLVWNSTSQLYTLNSTQHETLVKLNPSVTFTLSPSLPASSPGGSVSIVLPYSAFNLNTSWPFANPWSHYFPLKRAANDSQYVLGRTFLQEAYLIADYERGNFSVWPCSWDANTNNAKVATIRSINDTSNFGGNTNNNNTGGSNNSGLGTGAIAGIAVGAVVGIIAIGIGLFFWRRRRRQTAARSRDGATYNLDTLAAVPEFPRKDHDPGEELDSSIKHELAGHNKFGVFEAPDRPKFEMENTSKPHEAGGEEEQVYEMEGNGDFPPRIVVEPPTAIEPPPNGGFPSPVSPETDLNKTKRNPG